MKKNGKIKFKKGDLIIVLVLLVLCGVLFALSNHQQGTTARVTVDGETVFETDISQVTVKKDILLKNGITLTLEPGCIYFSSSPCSGKDCIRTGKLTRAGDCAVCLPEKTVIKILPDGREKLPDAISW